MSDYVLCIPGWCVKKDYLRIAEKAYDLLEGKIVDLELVPGRIYSETELSEIIGLGRTPMREALLRLAKEKLVEMIPRRGVRISDIDLTNHVALLETRKALDVLIATRAARRVNQQQKDMLRDFSKRMLSAGANKDIEEYLKVDRDLDLLLAKACKNSFAVEAVAHLYAHCKRFWSYYHEYLNIDLFARQHSELMLAVAGSDEEKAKSAVVDIIDHQVGFTKQALDL
jgi:DNA-binding GntR family transcriptional regulator